MKKTKLKTDLQTEVFHLSNVAGNLAKENAILRARCEAQETAHQRLEERIAELEEALASKEKNYQDCETERASLEATNAEFEERINDLEEASDPETISAEVHDYLRSLGLLPASLDAPIKLAPHTYITGLHEAIQKAVPE